MALRLGQRLLSLLTGILLSALLGNAQAPAGAISLNRNKLLSVRVPEEPVAASRVI